MTNRKQSPLVLGLIDGLLERISIRAEHALSDRNKADAILILACGAPNFLHRANRDFHRLTKNGSDLLSQAIEIDRPWNSIGHIPDFDVLEIGLHDLELRELHEPMQIKKCRNRPHSRSVAESKQVPMTA
jgi:hypothetical protein